MKEEITNCFFLLSRLLCCSAGIGQCGCMSIADTYMGGKTTNSGGCATSVVPPYSPWGNCWDHSD